MVFVFCMVGGEEVGFVVVVVYTMCRVCGG